MTKDECSTQLNKLRCELDSDPRVDKSSLEQRCKIVEDKLEKETPEDAADIVAELRAAADLLRISTVRAIKFRRLKEPPDIEIQMDEHKVGVEVRRFRPKVGQKRNELSTEAKLFAAVRRGVLTQYGDPQKIEEEILDMIREKSQRCESGDYEELFLYVVSDSRHYVEDMEIKSAWGRALREVSRLTFHGLLFRWGNHSGLLLNHESPPSDNMIELLNQHYPIRNRIRWPG